MTNYVEELNKLITLAAQGSSFEPQGFRNFEQEEPDTLTKSLQSSNLFFTSSVLGMKAVSHVIEDQAINLGGSFRFFSAFQRFSRLKPQEKRYRRILELGNPVFIFGIPDVAVFSNPNLYVINLPEASGLEQPDLSHNWFVVLDSPEMVSMALVARELPNLGRPKNAPDKLLYRNFEGFWTYDQSVITEVASLLDGYVRQTNQPKRF